MRTIQVKTTDQSLKIRRGWLIGKRAEKTVSPSHFYVFVMLNGDSQPDYYIVPSKHVADKISGAASMPEFRKIVAEEYRDRWELLNR
ncbi:MAG: hypothetical protein A3E78_08395 [Alphaproteobacteria bacterium RIFCSPHIGHO2_12_FULL_63_12]|nr:MAG: hypothetical protein A3E78_08395 [Alphaproteobacteria bacterium RIFCSPHIGHO2_12_FULL_63_12]